VPYLIPFLSSPQQNTIVGWALRQITGMNFSSKARLWDEWWEAAPVGARGAGRIGP
jgi:hypothetical protein